MVEISTTLFSFKNAMMEGYIREHIVYMVCMVRMACMVHMARMAHIVRMVHLPIHSRGSLLGSILLGQENIGKFFLYFSADTLIRLLCTF